MKIAFLTHAGASIYHFRMPIIKALRARGDEVIVLTPKDEYASRLESLAQSLDFKLVFYEMKRSSLNPFVVLSNFLSLARLLKSLQIDLIQTAAHKSNTLGILAAQCAKIKVKIALVEGLGSFFIGDLPSQNEPQNAPQNPAAKPKFKSKFQALKVKFSPLKILKFKLKAFKIKLKQALIQTAIKALYKLSFKLADAFIFVNESNAQFMKNLGLKESKIHIIKSVGINLARFFPVKIAPEQRSAFLRSLDLDSAKPVVLMIARALWHKGVREFYEAASALKDEASFIYAGGLDESPSCASLAFMQSGAVRYLGTREDIPFLLNLCDIFALPSYKEGFPVSVLEAKACAKPCVVSDCEGCVEAISDAVDGLYAQTASSKDLADKLKLLIEDKKLREILGANAFKDALKYDEKSIAKKYLQIYDKIFVAAQAFG